MPEELRTYERTNHSGSCDPRVRGDRHDKPWGVCVHTTSGSNSLAWLLGASADAGTPASADALIDRDGHQHIITDAGHYAYHAGQSYWWHSGDYVGDEVSQALLGVELECLNDQAPTFEQYDSLAMLVVQYGLVWGWRFPYIVLGHYAVARPIGRRSDPVNFDWGSWFGRLYVHALSAKVPGLVED